MERARRQVSRRTALRGGVVGGLGLVTVSLPSTVAAASVAIADTTTTSTTAAPAPPGYDPNGTSDPGMMAINAVPVVTTTGSVEVSGSDTVG